MTQAGWRLVREIGRGAYGVVYVAVNGKGERAAVKVCRRDDIGDECYERELRGAKLYKSIPPQDELLRMRELAVKPGGFYTVMDLADDEFGGVSSEAASYRPKTLAKVIDGEKALPLKECVTLGISIAKGLAVLQRHHLLHRDIKPGNVIYIKGHPVLSDPGLVVEGSEAVSQVGTPSYAPPEGFTNDTGDIYSLGMTLKAASFGRRIEDLNKGPAIEADTGAKFFPAWWRILNKATDANPRQRYQSAKALLKDLESLSRKIALTPIIGSRVAKIVIALFVLAFITIIVFPLFSFKSGIEANMAWAKRDAEWAVMLVDNVNLVDFNISSVSWRIDEIAATNKAVGAELHSLVDRMKSLGGKLDSLSSEIKMLSDRVPKDKRDGSSDKREFQDARKLAEERKKVRKEINAIDKEIRKRLGFNK